MRFRLKIKFVLLSASLAAFGCTTAEFVRKDFTARTAVLRYDADSFESRAKSEVDSEARKFCGGDYRVTRETESRDVVGYSGVGTPVGYSVVASSEEVTEMHHYVEIACK